MHNLRVIKRSLHNRTLSWSLSHDISTFIDSGKIAIVAHRPGGLLSATRKQHLARMRSLQHKKISTLDSSRKLMFANQIEKMQSTAFTAKAPEVQLEVDVTFATAEDFVCAPPICHAVFITYSFEREKLHMLTNWMPKDGVIVIYG